MGGIVHTLHNTTIQVKIDKDSHKFPMQLLC